MPPALWVQNGSKRPSGDPSGSPTPESSTSSSSSSPSYRQETATVPSVLASNAFRIRLRRTSRSALRSLRTTPDPAAATATIRTPSNRAGWHVRAATSSLMSSSRSNSVNVRHFVPREGQEVAQEGLERLGLAQDDLHQLPGHTCSRESPAARARWIRRPASGSCGSRGQDAPRARRSRPAAPAAACSASACLRRGQVREQEHQASQRTRGVAHRRGATSIGVTGLPAARSRGTFRPLAERRPRPGPATVARRSASPRLREQRPIGPGLETEEGARPAD